MQAERRINPGDLVTARFGHGEVLHQNLFRANARDARLREGDHALVTWVGKDQDRDVCEVLFQGEVWRANTIGLRVVE